MYTFCIFAFLKSCLLLLLMPAFYKSFLVLLGFYFVIKKCIFGIRKYLKDTTTSDYPEVFFYIRVQFLIGRSKYFLISRNHLIANKRNFDTRKSFQIFSLHSHHINSIFRDELVVGLFVVFRIYVALAIFQPYRDVEAGDNKSMKS